MLELICGVLFAAGAILFVLRPVFRPEAGGGENREARGVVDEGEDPEDDLSPRAVALRALKEIEFDRATGKLSDADYDALKRTYTAQALATLRAEMRDAGRGMREVPGLEPGTHPASRISHPVCPTHGPRRETDAVFCSECGRRVATAPGYCARCGTALEREAKYCHTCGARVAA
ncbi:MAG TPA: zinc ribbon domain-containing protein [Gemmatimonadales bacterium]|nr:zinc ribbon domain-containing protein [Gemmatimonadales bacterium]